MCLPYALYFHECLHMVKQIAAAISHFHSKTQRRDLRAVFEMLKYLKIFEFKTSCATGVWH